MSQKQSREFPADIFFFLLSLLFALVVGSNGQLSIQDNPPEFRPTPLDIGKKQSISRYIFSEDGKYQAAAQFQVTITEKIPNLDLAILVNGRQDFSHNPQMTYSNKPWTEEEFMDFEQNTGVNCGFTGHEFCIIPESEIETGSQFNIAIFCMLSCQFDILATYNSLRSQQLGESKYYKSYSSDQSIIEAKILIPSEGLSDDIQYIIIESFMINIRTVKSNYHMYVNKGDSKPSPSNYDFITKPTKFYGQSVIISRKRNDFQAGGNFTVSIEAPAGAQIVLKSEAIPKIRPLQFYHAIDDLVKEGEVRLFYYTIPIYSMQEWFNSDISFLLVPYLGNPDIYVIDSELPSDPTQLKEYKWKSTELSGIEQLTLTNHSTESKYFAGATFYIAIYGQTSATFSLMVFTTSMNNWDLAFNEVQIGYAKHEEIILYELNLYDVMASDRITIYLDSIMGSHHIYLRKCTGVYNKYQCRITNDAIKSAKKSASVAEGNSSDDNFFVVGKKERNIHQITLNYSSDDCIDVITELSNCYFILGVQGLSRDDLNEFRLYAKYAQQVMKMREGFEYREFYLQGDIGYYSFTVDVEDPSISKIEFSLTAISGQINVYTSRNTTRPTESSSDFIQQGSDFTIAYSRNDKSFQKNSSLKGSYYMTISSLTGSTVLFYVKVYREKFVPSEDGSSHKIHSTIPRKIRLGEIATGVLPYQHSDIFYFEVPQNHRSTLHETSISLFFKSPNTSFFSPTPITISIEYKVDSMCFPVERAKPDTISSQFIYIKVKSSFLDHGKYYITLLQDNSLLEDQKIEYQLSINAQDTILLVPNTSSISELKEQSHQNYEMLISEESLVYFEVFDCFGSVKFDAARSQSHLESGKFDVQPQTLSRQIDGHLTISYQLQNPGQLYTSVSYVDGIEVQGQMQSLYRIIPHVLPLNVSSPFEMYEVPQDKELSVISVMNIENPSELNSLQVTFPPIRCTKDTCENSHFQEKSVYYTVYLVNQEQHLPICQKCDIRVDDLQKLGFITFNSVDYQQKVFVDSTKERLDEQYKVEFSQLQNDTYYIGIKAIVYLQLKQAGEDKTEGFTFNYPMRTYQVGDGKPSSQAQMDSLATDVPFTASMILFILASTAILILALICIYKQVKIFIIRRQYRIAMEKKDSETGNQSTDQVKQLDEISANPHGNINENDEKMERNQVEKLYLNK